MPVNEPTIVRLTTQIKLYCYSDDRYLEYLGTTRFRPPGQSEEIQGVAFQCPSCRVKIVQSIEALYPEIMKEGKG